MKDLNRERPRFRRGIYPAIVRRSVIDLAAGWRGFRFETSRLTSYSSAA